MKPERETFCVEKIVDANGRGMPNYLRFVRLGESICTGERSFQQVHYLQLMRVTRVLPKIVCFRTRFPSAPSNVHRRNMVTMPYEQGKSTSEETDGSPDQEGGKGRHLAA
jgi:hypothetical protein